MTDEPDVLVGATTPRCAYCGSDDHNGPDCPTLQADGGELDPDAEGSR